MITFFYYKLSYSLRFLLAIFFNKKMMKNFSTRAISTAGVLRMIGKVENAITKQVTQRMTEAEPWFEERTNQVNALQVGFLT